MQTGLGELCLHKFNDVNGNGVQDAGEPPIAGIKFEILDQSGALILSGSTNAAGDLCTGPTMPPGLYPISEVLPAHSPWLTNYVSGYAAAMVTAGNLHIGMIPNRTNPNGRICVHKYVDANANGQVDASELTNGVGGIGFEVKDASGAVVAAGVTVAGLFCTPMNLPPGWYTVTENLGATGNVWVSTDPGGATPSKIVFTLAGNTGDVWFGNHYGPIVPAPSLTIEKLSYNHCSGAPGSTCVFEIRIRNTGTLPYTGPLTFSDDTIPSVGVNFVAVQMATGWTCWGSQPMTCTNPSVTIPAGGLTGLLLSVTITGPGWPNQNCASLTVPVTTAASCATIESKYELGVAIYPNPGGNSSTPTNKTFVIRVQANQTMNAGTPLVVGGSLSPTGNFSSISTATPGWTCTGTAAAFQCTFNAGGGTSVEQFQLDAGSTSGGQPFTMTATVSAGHNNDPYGTNNNATVSGILP